MRSRKIYNLITSLFILLSINTNFICGEQNLNLVIRNNLNGDFAEVEEISEIRPGAFINISWNNKNLMLPYSPRRGSISFSDKKWDFRYNFDKENILNEREPILYKLLSNGKFIENKCNLRK